MTIQAIGTTGLALYLTPGDLRARGLDPKALDLDQAIALTREACHSAGLCLPEPLEIEAYPDKAGILVFAQLRPAPPLVLSFAELAEVLSGLQRLPAPPEAAHLTYWDDRYYLLLPPQEGEIQAVLTEFGDLEDGVRMPALLAEHGELLMSTGALLRLYRALRR